MTKIPYCQPDKPCEFTPDQVAEIYRSIDMLRTCAPDHYAFALQYAPVIEPSPDQYSRPGFFDGYIHLSQSFFTSDLPPTVNRLDIANAWVHEARHMWQVPTNWSSSAETLDARVADGERDAYAFTLSLFDQCAATIPQDERSAFDRVRVEMAERALHPPPGEFPQQPTPPAP